MNPEQDDATKRYPCDPLEDESDYDEALDELNASRKDGSPHIPTFAQRMLERLKEVGLLHRTDTDPPTNARKVKLDKGQELWVRFDTRRDDEGYMAVEVMDTPRSDMAILAAITAWLAQPRDFKRILGATRYFLSGAYIAEIEKIGRIGASLRRTRTIGDPVVAILHGYMFKIRLDLSRFLTMVGRTEENQNITSIMFPRTGGDQDIALENVDSSWKIAIENVELAWEESAWEEVVSAQKSLANLEAKIEPLRYLEYLLPLIRHYRPEFDNHSFEEQQNLIEKTCCYINDFLESLHKLQAFLQYGSPNRKLAPAIKEPKREVRAAILHEVDGLNYRQIGERMGVPLPPDFEIKGEHQTVRKMVERGQLILEEAFGREGWRERTETMKAQKAWWRSLSIEERDNEWVAERIALDHAIPIEEARRWV